MTMARSFAVVAFALGLPCFSATAWAQGIPEYNVDQLCRSNAAQIGGGNMATQLCIELEQHAYDRLKIVWPTLEPNIKAQCIGIGAYQRLYGCILNARADAAAGDRTFKK